MWAVLVLVPVHGCSSWARLGDPELKPLYGEVVDSIVVLPYTTADGLKVSLNSTQLKLFQELLVAQLEARPNLRLFEEPPTELSNTLLIESRLTHFDVEDLPGKEFSLRNIHLRVEWRFRTADQDSTSRVVRRRLSYQRIYPPETTVPALDFDLQGAVSDITAQIVEIMYPTPAEEGLRLADARDSATGEIMGHPLLLRGNGYAAEGRLEKAKDSWRRVLFDPTQPEAQELFRISPRTLLLLRQAQVEDDIIDRLRPLTEEEPQDLLDFRDSMRKELGGFHQIEPTVLKLANHHKDTRHLNMAAAHRNLAMVYRLEKRIDVMSYHLARAQANYPHEEYLDTWTKLQEGRDAIPVEFTNDEAIGHYMRIPAPGSAWVAPGDEENSLFPPVVFENRAPATAPAPSEAAFPAQTEASAEDAPLKPVELEPPPAPEEADSPDLPPVQTPEQAGG